MFDETKCIWGVSGRPNVKAFRVSICWFFSEPLKREFAVKLNTKRTFWGPQEAKQHKQKTVKKASNQASKNVIVGFILAQNVIFVQEVMAKQTFD